MLRHDRIITNHKLQYIAQSVNPRVIDLFTPDIITDITLSVMSNRVHLVQQCIPNTLPNDLLYLAIQNNNEAIVQHLLSIGCQYLPRDDIFCNSPIIHQMIGMSSLLCYPNHSDQMIQYLLPDMGKISNWCVADALKTDNWERLQLLRQFTSFRWPKYAVLNAITGGNPDMVRLVLNTHGHINRRIIARLRRFYPELVPID